ncbi:hypothetical protein BCR34DRAFT_606008 [Clohesyomyces aquaticus]|uniref:Uncharacterized protein n=1 Tax=Clohesyomyces aquaticus TaxID=1231657 RepID=A0A1Y1YTC2_9PLEO|nr:hypothetical protein BCR34DRAFT_606008 [Clohesyomyces aquaticus]
MKAVQSSLLSILAPAQVEVSMDCDKRLGGGYHTFSVMKEMLNDDLRSKGFDLRQAPESPQPPSDAPTPGRNATSFPGTEAVEKAPDTRHQEDSGLEVTENEQLGHGGRVSENPEDATIGAAHLNDKPVDVEKAADSGKSTDAHAAKIDKRIKLGNHEPSLNPSNDMKGLIAYPSSDVGDEDEAVVDRPSAASKAANWPKSARTTDSLAENIQDLSPKENDFVAKSSETYKADKSPTIPTVTKGTTTRKVSQDKTERVNAMDTITKVEVAHVRGRDISAIDTSKMEKDISTAGADNSSTPGQAPIQALTAVVSSSERRPAPEAKPPAHGKKPSNKPSSVKTFVSKDSAVRTPTPTNDENPKKKKSPDSNNSEERPKAKERSPRATDAAQAEYKKSQNVPDYNMLPKARKVLNNEDAANNAGQGSTSSISQLNQQSGFIAPRPDAQKKHDPVTAPKDSVLTLKGNLMGTMTKLLELGTDAYARRA